jgi:hypothetical protein
VFGNSRNRGFGQRDIYSEDMYKFEEKEVSLE